MTPIDEAPPVLDPPNVADAWPVWRVIGHGYGTLAEIETHWWVEDVLDANEAIDVEIASNPRQRRRR